MYDFHSHILPNIDDGSKSVEQSINMLTILKNSNIKAVVATPHYYINRNSIERFLEKRENAYQLLQNNINLLEYPKIIKGAEVLLTSELADLKDLHKLCVENTNYILIEMPYIFWTDWVYHAIYKIIAQHNLIPIIVHIERYIDLINDKSKIDKLLYLEVITQVNASSIIDRGTNQKKVLNLIQSGHVHLIGTDSHDDCERPPKISEAFEIIIKKLGIEKLNELNENARSILNL